MTLSKEREAEIRAINAWTSTQEENPLKVRDELLAEIERLRGEQQIDLSLHKESLEHLKLAVSTVESLEAEKKSLTNALADIRNKTILWIRGDAVGVLRQIHTIAAQALGDKPEK